MVTISQARQEIAARRQQIRQARLPEISPAQLRARGREQIITRELEARELQARKEAAREELIPFEEQIVRAEREQIQVSKQADITRTAFEMIRRKAAGKSISLQNEAVRLEFRRILREDSFLRQAVEAGAGFRIQQIDFRQAGLIPIVVGGKVTGFEDVIGKQSITLENIGSLSQDRLGILERAGLVEFGRVPAGIISAIERPEGLAGVGFDITELRGRLEETKRRQTEFEQIPTRLGIIGLGVGAELISQALGIKQLVTKPGETFVGIKEEAIRVAKGGTFPQVTRLIQTSPEFATGRVIGFVLGLKGTQFVFTKVPPVVAAQLTRLDPKFIPVRDGIITGIPSASKLDKAVFDIQGVRGQFQVASRIQGTTNIRIGGSVADLSETLQAQTRLAGQRVLAVSGQRDIFGVVRRRQIDISKPIAGEELLSRETARLLSDFREGRLPSNRFIDLNRRINLETKGAGGLLETSFFADPRGRLRPSRLGIGQKEANLLDVLSGDVTFKRARPQALFFEDVKIAKFPPALQGIKHKLLKNIPLTDFEKAKLLRFQLTITGEFKPIGFLTREPEIVLANGEVIRRIRTEAVTIINGRRVPIIRTEIIRDVRLSELFKKVGRGKASKSEISALSKATGIDFSRVLAKARFVSLGGLGISGISGITRLRRIRRAPLDRVSLIGSSKPSGFSRRIRTSISRKAPRQTLRRRSTSPLSPTPRGTIRKPFSRTSLTRRIKPTFRGASPLQRGRITRVPPILRVPPTAPPPRPKDFVKKRRIPTEFEKEGFDVFVRKKMKDRRIATDLTREEAKRRLKRTLEFKLRASGFITDPFGKRIKVNLGRGFRPSKIEPFRVVERRSRRLSTKSEVKRIQELRKSRPRKKKK